MPSPIFVIRRHHDGRCLHTFIMVAVLENGKKIPLNFTSGTVLVLKPGTAGGRANLNASGRWPAFVLELFNATGDILLYISISPRRITFKDFAHRSLGDGWGKEQTVEMKFAHEGGTVSIHHYMNDSKFGRYQILLNGITVCLFDKRLPGPATWISYKDDVTPRGDHGGWGPFYWDVGVYQIGDLLPEDRLALVRG